MRFASVDVVVLTFCAFLLRLFELERRVFHHDEAAVGFFTYKLFSQGVYSYNPAFHGPLLYYATAAVYRVLGDGVWSSRLLPAIFGVMLIPLVFALRDCLGRRGVFIAGFFFAFSPSFLYYSRFFRNDIFVVFFILAALVCALKYLKSGKLVFACLSGVFFGFSASAKENTYIYLAIFLSYFAVTSVVELLSKKPFSFRRDFPAIILGFAGFALVYTLFYTDFLSNPAGIHTSLERAFSHWYEMHRVERVGGPWYFYLPILLLYELPVVIFAVAGAVYYLRRGDEFKGFLTYWFLMSLAAYSYLGEKVPWLILHILLPAVLLASAFLGEAPAKLEGKASRGVFAAVLSASLFLSVFSGVQLNYYNYTNASEPLIQAAQPPQQFQELLDRINDVAAQYDGYDTDIQVTDVEVETQFLWYLRHYKNIHWKTSLDSKFYAPLIVVHDENASIVENKLRGGYQRLDSARMNWYWFKSEDITPQYILFRKMNRPPDTYGVVLFYRNKSWTSKV
jgi:uncharacterized protein (TIGR03663 family)